MKHLPIIEHQKATPSPEAIARSLELAEELRVEHPEFEEDRQFQRFYYDKTEEALTLHLDDLSEIPLLDRWRDICFMQERCRLRAGEGDLVATNSPLVEGFNEYCRDRLQLGEVEWFRPEPRSNPLKIAEACWEDRAVRKRLVHLTREHGRLHIHPHMGTFGVWELASLIHKTARCDVRVLAPPPQISKWVNNKISFADTVVRLFGEEHIPRSFSAANFTTLARHIHELAKNAKAIAVKLPNSAGGGGNIVLEEEVFKNKTVQEIFCNLKSLVGELRWEGVTPVLVGSWEENVLCSPSTQIWIPPEEEGEPIVEGLFEQSFETYEMIFIGSRPVELPEETTRQIVEKSWLMAVLFQKLGYVGRCSFDMIVVGNSLDENRLEFIECNGRWGGTSLPMTLINRMFGDWSQQPFATRDLHLKGLDRYTFIELCEKLNDDLYDARTNSGKYILFNAGRIEAQFGITVLGLANSWPEVNRLISEDFPKRLARWV